MTTGEGDNGPGSIDGLPIDEAVDQIATTRDAADEAACRGRSDPRRRLYTAPEAS